MSDEDVFIERWLDKHHQRMGLHRIKQPSELGPRTRLFFIMVATALIGALLACGAGHA